jgi:hypothetical protein
MLSEKVIKFIKNKGYISITEEEKKEYTEALIDLNIQLNTSFSEFNLLTAGPTYKGRKYELYNVCWFKIYSDDLEYGIESARNILKLPEEYLPLDSFEGEGGFFYNKRTGEVLEIELGKKLNDFHSGKLSPQWKDFNSFLEWYFEIE